MSRRTRIRMAVRVLLFAVLLAASGLGLWAWRRSATVAELPTAPARQGDFLVMVRCRGELVARRSVQITAPLDVPDLQIIWVAPPGSAVKVGQTVVRFDPSHSEQDLKEKKTALQQAQATLDQAVAQSRITADQDRLDLSTATYDAEKTKLEASKQSVISALEGQKIGIDLGLAQEKVKVQAATTVLHGKSDEAKIASFERLRDAAKTEVKVIQERLGLMDLKSPLNGVINYASNYSQGWMNAQPFKVGDHTSGGVVIAEIPDLSTMEIESKVDEVDRGRIQTGDAVVVHVDAFPEKVLSAKLTLISPLTEQSFNEWPPTRSFRAFAKLENPDSRMRPSMNAGADIVQTKIVNAVSIPAKALFTLNGKPTVYVKKDRQYVPLRVNVRARNPDEIAIDGLAAGTPVALAEPGDIKR